MLLDSPGKSQVALLSHLLDYLEPLKGAQGGLSNTES